VDGFAFFVGGVLPYLALTVFLVGIIFRIVVWYKTPQPGKMTLFPTGNGTAGSVLAETLFFPSLFRGDKALWLFAWLFHVALALAFIGHFRVFSGLFDGMLINLGVSEGGIKSMSAIAGGAAGIVLLAAAGILLLRRLFSKRVREISGAPDFFALFLILAIIVTGNMMRFGAEHFDLNETRTWAAGLLTLSPVVPKNGMFLTHALLAQLLIMYIPFSKIMHFGGIFFTQALVKRR
jgi:nitrate reductase gamma subunit